jgi:hypothetical protein
MRDPNEAASILVFFIFVSVLAMAMLGVEVLSKDGPIKHGRNAGIILCIEKTSQCIAEYNYLKLKEMQK